MECNAVMSAYSCCARPGAAHRHPYLVFDCQGELHLPLIVLAKDALARLEPYSVKKYLTGILPWFTWLETDSWQVQANHHWTDAPQVVRETIREYLVSRLRCRMKDHPQGGEWLETTEEMLNAVRILLAGLKLFYRVAKEHGYYQVDNPLRGTFTEPVQSAPHQLVHEATLPLLPKMPDHIGADHPRRQGRLTVCYLLLQDP